MSYNDPEDFYESVFEDFDTVDESVGPILRDVDYYKVTLCEGDTHDYRYAFTLERISVEDAISERDIDLIINCLARLYCLRYR